MTHSIPSESRINVISYTIKNKDENVKNGVFTAMPRTILVLKRIFLNFSFS